MRAGGQKKQVLHLAPSILPHAYLCCHRLKLSIFERSYLPGLQLTNGICLGGEPTTLIKSGFLK